MSDRTRGESRKARWAGGGSCRQLEGGQKSPKIVVEITYFLLK